MNGPADMWQKAAATFDRHYRSIGGLLIHSWDLARAIGADDTLPADVVETVHLGLQRIPEEQMRSGAFGAEVDVADDASAQDKRLAFTGQRP